MGRRNWGHHGPSWRRSLTACCRATSLSASSSGAPGNLDPDEWAILRRVIDLIKTNANGAELGPVLETIENALRADTRRLALPRLVTWLIVGGARRGTCLLNLRPVLS